MMIEPAAPRPLDWGVHTPAERHRLYLEQAQAYTHTAREWLKIEGDRISTLVYRLNLTLDHEARGIRNPALQEALLLARMDLLEIQGLHGQAAGLADTTQAALAAAWSTGEQAAQIAARERGLLVWLWGLWRAARRPGRGTV